MDQVLFADAEIVNPEDFDAISQFARTAIDAIALGALGWPAHYTRFTVAKDASPDSVLIAPGDYYNGGAIYRASDAITLNLQTYKPSVATDERWIALILRGREDETNENRSFETGEQPLLESQPVVQATPKYKKRVAYFEIQLGDVAPPPALKPSVTDSDCAVAYVLLTSTGVEDVASNETDRVKSVYELDNRLSTVEVNVANLTQDTTTIKTDLSGVAKDLSDQKQATPPMWLVNQLARDAAMTRQALDLPDTARNYFWDGALLQSFWDLTHTYAHFRIREGIRFPYAQMASHIIRLLDQNNPAVTTYGNLVLPAHEREIRFELPVGDASQNLSNTVHTVVTAREVTESHTNIRYGETISKCENAAGWSALGNAKAGEIFTLNGQEFLVNGVIANFNWTGHHVYSLTKIIRETVSETYVVYDSNLVGLTGAIYYQTFPNSQYMQLLAIQLYFTRVGSTGDVTLCLSTVRSDGVPDFNNVIKHVTVSHEDLATGWVEFDLGAAVLEPGTRYAWFVVTTGNHEISKTTGNAFPDGTAGKSTDGVWAQGSITEDYSFRLVAATFESSRVVVAMEPLTLENGMTEIDMVYQSTEAGSASIEWETKATGTTDWVLMDDGEDNPLANLPPLVEWRAIFVGTPDFMPGLIMDDYARAVCGRPSTTMQAVTQELSVDVASDTFQIITYMDQFDAAHHTVAPKLIVGGVVEDPDSVTLTIDRTKSTRTKVVANFTLAATATEVIARLDASTDSVINIPFGQDIQINAF